MYEYMHIHTFKWKDKLKSVIKITSIGGERMECGRTGTEIDFFEYTLLCRSDFGTFI